VSTITGLIIAGIICLVLMFQRWFWSLAFGIGSAASCFALLNSLVHLKILDALVFFCLMLICWSIAKAIAKADSPPPKEPLAKDTHPSFKIDDPDWSPP